MGTVSPRSERGLDWFNFFVADIQTGFGPYLAVYLTTQKWTQSDIGLVLALGSIAGLACQIPGGWIVDWVWKKRRLASYAVIGIGASALSIAAVPSFLAIASAKLIHVASSAILGPAIAAITLGLVGHAALSVRLGRNARYNAIGSMIAAATMGVVGSLISPQAVFFLTAALALPALYVLTLIRDDEIDPICADGNAPTEQPDQKPRSEHAPLIELLRKRSLLAFGLSIFLFHAANAAMLPLVGTEVTMRAHQWASMLIAACIIVPQLIVALAGPAVGRLAVEFGRRPLLIVGFAALPARATLLASTNDPLVIVAVQILDGICAAVLGVLVPLTIADISEGTGRFNLAQGIIASATGIGAAVSAFVAGTLATELGSSAAFLALAAAAALAFLSVLFFMPETGTARRGRRRPTI